MRTTSREFARPFPPTGTTPCSPQTRGRCMGADRVQAETSAVLLDAGSVDDYDEGHVRIFRVRGREIGVLRWGDRFFALLNRCPHAAGPLCAGRVAPRLRASRPEP